MIAELKQEFAEQEKQYAEISEKAQSHANLMLKLGFLGSLSQLVGFTLGIYVIYDWNEMEPYTWIICKYCNYAAERLKIEMMRIMISLYS